MKKSIIFVLISLLSLTLLSAGFAVKYYIKTQKLQNKIVSLEATISDMSSKNDTLKKDSEILDTRYENLKSKKSAIEIIAAQEQECLKKENYTTAGMNHCVHISLDRLEKEIEKNITLLKSVMTFEQYELLQKSQEAWEDYKKAEMTLNRETVGNNSGTIYTNILAGHQFSIVEKRAKDLSILYSELAGE